MSFSRKRIHGCRWAMVSLVLVAGSADAISGCDGPGSCDYTDYLPATKRAYGKPFKSWSAEWWQLMLSVPSGANPMLDVSGGRCGIGQRGPVWFLAGVFAGIESTEIVRDCDVPQGKAIFFPVLTTVQLNSPNVCGDPPSDKSVTSLRTAAEGEIAKATVMSVTVDGSTIPNMVPDSQDFRVKSTVFEAFMPEDNVFDAPCSPADVPSRIYSPAVADGLYVMLKPLSVGPHEVHILGANSDGFSLDVTYRLNVVPVRKK